MTRFILYPRVNVEHQEREERWDLMDYRGLKVASEHKDLMVQRYIFYCIHCRRMCSDFILHAHILNGIQLVLVGSVKNTVSF